MVANEGISDVRSNERRRRFWTRSEVDHPSWDRGVQRALSLIGAKISATMASNHMAAFGLCPFLPVLRLGLRLIWRFVHYNHLGVPFGLIGKV